MEITLRLHSCYLTSRGKVIKITNRYKRSSDGTTIFVDRDGWSYSESGSRLLGGDMLDNVREEVATVI